MTFKKIPSVVLINLLVPFLIVLGLELFLQLFWNNPYLNKPLDISARLHSKNMNISVTTEGFYTYKEPVLFRTLKDRSIFSGKITNGSKFLALGGSTTESSLVPQGQRWPDLLIPPAINYGVSGNYLVDSYYNLIYLHNNLDSSPTTVTIMHAVNDLEFFVNQGSQKFDIQGWLHPLENPLAIFDNTDRDFIPGIRVSDSSVMSLITYLRNNTGARRIIEPYVAQRRSRDAMSSLDNESFLLLKNQLIDEFLPKRLAVLEKIYEVAEKLDIRLIMLTQPHAFIDDYTPPIQDLRVTPVWQGAKLTLQQTSVLIELINAQTKMSAQESGVKVIDLAKCIGAREVGPLLFDSVHYSLKGSRTVAECINGEMAVLNL